MQLTTISGMYTPRASLIATKYACMISCTIVTNDATMTMKAGRRTSSGIILRTREITILEMTRTAIVEAPMPMAFVTDVVTARAGHIPSIMIKTGFSLTIPL